MVDVIIVALVAAAVLAGVFAAVRHFRGQGGCCGGGTYRAKTKRLKVKADEKTFTVEGMSCQHCVNRVMEAVQDMPGLSAAVQLRKGCVKVCGERTIDVAAVTAAIERAGYTVTGVR